jgi:ABC-2 type transport system ATP-binding protein
MVRRDDAHPNFRSQIDGERHHRMTTGRIAPLILKCAVIEVQDLTKQYGRTVAVDKLTFGIRPGQVTAFLGPNGAGKSTTMRILLGLARANNGFARIDGLAYSQLRQPLAHVGALLEGFGPNRGLKAFNHLLWVAQTNRIERRRVMEVLELVDLAGVSHRRVGEFSLGMGQRLGLAVALLGDPPILVLDEPSNGLDPEGIHWLRQFLRRLAADGRTVFVSSHLMAEMAVTADQLIVINKGRLLADTSTAEFIKRNASNFVRLRTQEPERFRLQLSAAGIAAVLAQDGSIEVSGASAAEVNRLAAANHILLDELSTESASLEEAFLRLTNPTNESAP